MSRYEPQLRIRIDQIDHTLIQPGSLDDATLARVPVIRVYGVSSFGAKACVHIHQVYPYLYANCPCKLEPSTVKQYICKLQRALNYTIAVSLNRDPRSARSQFIRAIVLVKGVHFYGFHSSYSPFLKIFVADPTHVNRIATILQSGSVMNTRFFVYESHLNFTLQFLSDFGLYGCGWLELEEVFQRGPNGDDIDSHLSKLTGPLKASDYFRQSRMSLEFDAIAPHILNRRAITVRDLHHKLVIPAPHHPNGHLVQGVRELWEDERNRRKAKGLNPTPEMPIDPSSSSRGAGGEWVAECRWWEDVRARILHEAEEAAKEVAMTQDWEAWVMTAFDSIEALWEDSWKTPKFHPLMQSGVVQDVGEESGSSNKEHELDVDLRLLFSNESDWASDDEELEWDLGVNMEEQLDDDDVDDDDENEEEEDDGDEDDDAIDEDLKSEETWSQECGTDSQSSPSSSSNPFVVKDGVKYSQRREYKLNSLPEMMDIDIESPAEESCPSTTRAQRLPPKRSPSARTPTRQRIRPFFASSQTSSSMSSEEEQRPLKRRKVMFDDLHGEHVTIHQPPPELSSDTRRVAPKNKRPIRPTFIPSRIEAENKNKYVYSHPPPSAGSLQASLGDYGLPAKVYRAPYFSKSDDGPIKPKEHAGLVFYLQSGTGIDTLESWDVGTDKRFENKPGDTVSSASFQSAEAGGWEYASSPPSVRETRRWLNSSEGKSHNWRPRNFRSQIKGPTETSRVLEGQGQESYQRHNLSVLSLEIYAPSSSEKHPDPRSNEVAMAFVAYQDAECPPVQTRIFAVQSSTTDPKRFRSLNLNIIDNELELINMLADFIIDMDPDILVGWEIQKGSWGHLNARARVYGLEMQELIARAPPKKSWGDEDQWGSRTTSTFRVAGRHVFNLWRIIRAEQKYTNYTFEHASFNLLRRRIPFYTPAALSHWFRSSVPAHGIALIHYFRDRALANIEILRVTDIVTKTAEFARVFGVDFFSVISRGSQYKVESFMLRIAKPENFILLSPSKSDVGRQNAAECMPLIMEPFSAFYTSPMVVLDFQSLYPSLMIAYNYCYSTCLGRISTYRGQNKLGVVDLVQPPGLVDRLYDRLTVAPNGIMYVKPEVRKGLLGRMLQELLDTRVMVKQSMKVNRADKALRRILDARQLSLKYICNVTYGYTSATYSGRMPAVEIADSIVQSGRETLEKAINLINSTERWGAKVVYGDTDSVFVYLRGKTREQAFRIGAEIAEAVTSLNPAPVKLKFEKVYHPCVLLAKKRYVGAKYEAPDDRDFVFEAKGIETVRRDGVPAQRKILERALRTFFHTHDLSEVKGHCIRSWTKILENRVSIQDFIFSKEVKLGTYSDKGPPPPGVAVAVRRMLRDPNDEPQYGERIPYVITKGMQHTRLVDRAIGPLEYLKNTCYELDADYYIKRVLIPPLDRVFGLLGVDVRQWFYEMPRSLTVEPTSPSKSRTIQMGSINLDEHFQSSVCIICGGPAPQGICFECWESRQSAIASLSSRIQAEERQKVSAHIICASCTSTPAGEPIHCESLDCPWMFARCQANDMEDFVGNLGETIEELHREEEAKNSWYHDKNTPPGTQTDGTMESSSMTQGAFD